MGVPAVDNNYVTEAQARLTSRYANAKVVNGIVAALATRLQAYETLAQQFLYDIVLANHPLPGGPWDILDKIGSIVGEAREGRTDADYVQAIRLRIRANNSNGLAEDLIALGSLALPQIPPYYSDFWNAYPASWRVFCFNLPSPASVAELMAQAKAAGTYGELAYTTWPIDQPTIFSFQHTDRSVKDCPGFADGVNKGVTPGGVLAACFPCT